MKGWNMIHQIKALYDEGEGLSKSEIARRLNISRPKVRKYLNMSESEIVAYQQERERMKELDGYRHVMVNILQRYPKLSSGKVRRQLERRGIVVAVSQRTLRRYVEQWKRA